jgi:hypothetical protein
VKRTDRPTRSIRARGSVLAGLVASVAAAVDRLRARRRGPSAEIAFTEERRLWDDEDGGLASAGVPRRPHDSSGSGSAALIEPDNDAAGDTRHAH